MSLPSVVIYGVGRSGTTALFKNLTKAYALLQAAPQIRYEPFLWNVRDVPGAETFLNTEVLSPVGVAAHCTAPIFLGTKGSTSLDHFVSSLSLDESPSLVKFIRACGRIEYFIKKWPEARFIFIFREPCGVVSSALSRFSFFGDEFHPSDERRFAVETGRKNFSEIPYTLKQLAYWRDMNEAGINSAKIHKNRVLPISQEALLLDPRQTMETVLRFCFGDELTEGLGDIQSHWSRATDFEPAFKELGPGQFDDFRKELDWYEKVLLPSCAAGVTLDTVALRRNVFRGWIQGLKVSSGREDRASAELSRDLQPLILRDKLLSGMPGAAGIPETAYLVFRVSKFRRLWQAYRVLLGAPISIGGSRYLVVWDDPQRTLKGLANFSRSGIAMRLSFYLSSALGLAIQMTRFLEPPLDWKNETAIVLVRRGSVLRRALASLKYLWVRKVSLEGFYAYRYLE